MGGRRSPWRFALGLLLTLPAWAACPDWPAWQQFRQHYISAEGRVIDPDGPRKVTTSEGQSYALFFALVANDRPAFEQLLQWTENNLSAGDITARLPAWLWGLHDDGSWTVLDANSASDADLWIAYSLLEGGRLWQSRRLQSQGTLLLQRIAREEVVAIPGLGAMLLPGKKGFSDAQGWRLNPSYQPPQLLARFARLGGPWREMIVSNRRLWLDTAPHGFAPDWAQWRSGDAGWQPDPVKGGIGSYDAIRVYLWTGMMADDSADKALFSQRFQAMVQATEQRGAPPEKVDTQTGALSGQGPVGFSAALLPLLADSPALASQRQRLAAHPPGVDAYYSAVLTLFGQGWDQRRYRFNQQGELLPAWGRECTAAIAN